VRAFRVGISWQGSPRYAADRHRAIPLAHFLPLAGVPGVQLFSLQKGLGLQQIAQLKSPVPLIDLDRLSDNQRGAFMDTAAVMANLDLAVTSDTAIAHLADTAGAPVWSVLSACADYRWLRDRDTSPWYPTMRLFRQRAVGDWEEVFARVVDALRERAALEGHGTREETATSGRGPSRGTPA
jgi:hypothetical protein